MLVESLSFPIDLENLALGVYVLPLVSPLFRIRDEIAAVLTQHRINGCHAQLLATALEGLTALLQSANHSNRRRLGQDNLGRPAKHRGLRCCWDAL